MLAKTDIESVFHLPPVHPDSFCFLGFIGWANIMLTAVHRCGVRYHLLVFKLSAHRLYEQGVSVVGVNRCMALISLLVEVQRDSRCYETFPSQAGTQRIL